MNSKRLGWYNGYDQEAGYYLYEIIVVDDKRFLKVLQDEDGCAMLFNRDAAQYRLKELRGEKDSR